MKKIKELLSRIPEDKLLHFTCGAVIFGISFVSLNGSCVLSLFISLILAAGKEVYDYKHPENHTCDIFDFIATMSGSFLVFIVLYLL